VNHSSTPDACGEWGAIGGHRRPRRGTCMLCDRHQRLRLPPSCSPLRDCDEATDRCVWTQMTPPMWLHSPQCAECNHVGGRLWVGRVRRPASSQNCAIETCRFRRMPDGDRRTRRETSHTLAMPTSTSHVSQALAAVPWPSARPTQEEQDQEDGPWVDVRLVWGLSGRSR
jgi:hypothetical protein